MSEQPTGQTPSTQTIASAPSSTGGSVTTTTTSPPVPTPPATPKASEKQPPWGKPENFDADKAWELIQNLRTEKGAAVDEQTKAQLEEMRKAQEQQRDALAAALGIKPEETSDADKLAEQVESLRGQIVASERRALAVEFKVPEAMLTGTDAAAMRKQAEDLVAFAQAAHYAALSGQASAQQDPAFQANPSQGQNGGQPSKEELEQAEYEKYFPAPK